MNNGNQNNVPRQSIYLLQTTTYLPQNQIGISFNPTIPPPPSNPNQFILPGVRFKPKPSSC
jgi:hypothetical protein